MYYRAGAYHGDTIMEAHGLADYHCDATGKDRLSWFIVGAILVDSCYLGDGHMIALTC